MRFVVTGSSGLIGRALTASLRRDGHDVVAMVRRSPSAGEARWDPPSGTIDRAALEGVDAVVHLAGAGLADRRWTDARKAELVASRVASTGLLASAVAAAGTPAPVLVSASAVGWYGDRGDELLTESSGPGHGFLAELCAAWEAATGSAEEAGVRVVHLRTGIVLSTAGGALARQLPLFRLGLGGRLGSGRQWMSWIAVDDEVGAIRHAVEHPALRGPVNATAPHPVTNREFAGTLGRVLHRPAAVPVPGFALGLVLGRELAAEALLAGQRVVPSRLLETGYRFAGAELGDALRLVLTGDRSTA